MIWKLSWFYLYIIENFFTKKMQNINLYILGKKIDIYMIILIIVAYSLLIFYLFCPCVNIPYFYEALTNMSADPGSKAGAVNPASKPKSPGSSDVPATTAGKKKEGFSTYNLQDSAPYKLGDYSVPDVSSWFQQNMTVTSNGKESKGVKDILNRPKQPVPLPEGELLMFANTKFTPEACPNTYSNSMGCAEMTVEQYNYLQTRGGNNVPFSQY